MKIDFSVPNVSLRFLPWLKRTFFVLFTCIIGNVAADGLPGEYILSDRWRTLFKYNSPLTNPALIMEQFYSSIRGTASISPDDVSNLWEAGVIVPLGFYHTAGFTVIAENGKSVENWNIQNENVTTSKNSNYLFVGSYAINPWKKLCLGININGAYQGNFGDAPSFAIGVDLGVTYRLLLHPALGFHLVGLTFQNMISPQLSLYEPMPYSSKLKAYYHARMLRNRLDLDLQFDLTDFNSPSELFSGNQKQLEWNLGIQAGLWLLPFMAIRGFTDFGDRTTIEYWGLACELNVPQLNNARDFSFVYQFRNGIKTDVGGSQSIYFKMDVGKNREEFKVRKIARMVSLGANELYNKALKLYFRDDFWGAYFVFIRLLNEFPDFFKNDIASYYAGSCVEAMDMQDEALKIYQDSKNHYPLSSITPLTDLALMRIYFRKGAYEELSSQFAELNRMNVSDSIRAHGCYIMGQAEMQRKEYKNANQYFNLVPEDHPMYIYAQHSAAVAWYNLDNQEMAVASLENCISATATNAAQKELINRSMVFLGYLFYEENVLSKAIAVLKMVQPDSYYKDDCLMGLAWTALKAHQWKDCIDYGSKLAQSSPRFVNQCEGALLQAYGHMMEKRYEQAKALLEPVLEKINSFGPLTTDSLDTRKLKNESDVVSYAYLAETVTDAARKGNAAKPEFVDSLHNSQIDFVGKIRDYRLFEDEFFRRTCFERNLEKVREDLEYALATVTKILNKGTDLKVIDKIKDKDEEIKKLREEMEKLGN